jgi:formylglycine-generating enzyme required for sulfatase activity
LRLKLAGELQLRTGRQPKVHIFQDVAAILPGTDWLKEINRALDGSSFLLPIVTPAFLQSDMCCHEVMRFRRREEELGRDDLIFPFLYFDVSDIEAHEVHDPAVLALLESRQRIDFTPLRYRPLDSEEVATKLGGLAGSIRLALRRGVGSGAPPIAVGTAVPRAVLTQPELARPAVLGATVPETVMREGPGPEMVLIPAGRFLMGVPEAESKREGTSELDIAARPQHEVTISRPFWLGKYPVTRGEYAVFAAETGRSGESWSTLRFSQDDRHPVVNVSFEDAVAYVAWLNEKTGQTYRLPSEAELEYAARAGTTTARYWGKDAGRPGEHAHFGSGEGTCSVGSFKPNGFGLHDMLGNVWEWTADNWHADYTGAPSDGSAWTAGGAASRVVRGGSWVNDAHVVRAAYRLQYDPAYRNGILGFRFARVQV